MLCVFPGPTQDFIDSVQQSSEINKVILCTSSQLAECKKDEIETIIQRAMDVVSVIEHAEEAGWFFLSEAGELQDIFHPICSPFHLRSVFEDGLMRLPWCLAQLNAGEAVLVPSLDSLPPVAEIDRQILRSANVHSMALLPSSSSSRRTVLILLSTLTNTEWSDGIVEQSILLENIFSNAYQRKLAEDSLSLLTVETLIEHKSAERELRRKQSEVGVLASLLIRSQEDERKRLSRELHDDIGQRLSLAASEVAVMASQQSNATPIPIDRISALRDELDRLCSDIHEMSHSLHSYKLQHLGLKSALKEMCGRFSRSDFSVDLRVEDMEDPVSKEVSLCLYRVAQESLNNALKHAHAPAVAVILTKLQDKFYMTIQDSGIGFDSQTSSQGLGLISMSERLRGVNGQFRLNSIPGHGTEIWVEVPDQPDPLLARAS